MENNLAPYLQDSFEASSLTIVEIIQILTHHGIPLPAARQRKAFYVELLVNSLAVYKKEWIAQVQLTKNPFQSFSQPPVVVSPRRKSPRKTPQQTPKAFKATPSKDEAINAPSANDYSTPIKTKVPNVKTPYVVRTAQGSTLKRSTSTFASAVLVLFAIVAASNWLQFCNDGQKLLCLPCPRFSKCVGRKVQSCTNTSHVKKTGWWVTDWNLNLYPWPFNIEYCQDKSQMVAKETRKLLKLGIILDI